MKVFKEKKKFDIRKIEIHENNIISANLYINNTKTIYIKLDINKKINLDSFVYDKEHYLNLLDYLKKQNINIMNLFISLYKKQNFEKEINKLSKTNIVYRSINKKYRSENDYDIIKNQKPTLFNIKKLKEQEKDILIWSFNKGWV